MTVRYRYQTFWHLFIFIGKPQANWRAKRARENREADARRPCPVDVRAQTHPPPPGGQGGLAEGAAGLKAMGHFRFMSHQDLSLDGPLHPAVFSVVLTRVVCGQNEHLYRDYFLCQLINHCRQVSGSVVAHRSTQPSVPSR